MAHYFHELLATFSTFLNALRGGLHREPLCSAIHRNMEDGGFWARVPLPAWFVRHCEWSCSK